MQQAGSSWPSPRLSPVPEPWPKGSLTGPEPQGLVVGRLRQPGRDSEKGRGIHRPWRKPGSPVPTPTAAGATLTVGTSREYCGMWRSKAAPQLWPRARSVRHQDGHTVQSSSMLLKLCSTCRGWGRSTDKLRALCGALCGSAAWPCATGVLHQHREWGSLADSAEKTSRQPLPPLLCARPPTLPNPQQQEDPLWAIGVVYSSRQ